MLAHTSKSGWAISNWHCDNPNCQVTMPMIYHRNKNMSESIRRKHLHSSRKKISSSFLNSYIYIYIYVVVVVDDLPQWHTLISKNS